MDFEEMLGLKELGLKYQYELAGFTWKIKLNSDKMERW